MTDIQSTECGQPIESRKPLKNRAPQRTVIELSINLGMQGKNAKQGLHLGNSGKHFSGYYFQGVVTSLLSKYKSKSVDIYGDRPDVGIRVDGKQVYLEVKSAYIGNGIKFRPLQLQKFLNSETYSNSYCVLIFHGCDHIEQMHRLHNEKGGISHLLTVKSIFIFPSDFLHQKYLDGYFGPHDSFKPDTINNPNKDIGIRTFESLFNSFEGFKFSIHSKGQKRPLIFNAGLNIDPSELNLENLLR